ncbi:hypothetical protein HS088_TW14G00398 [Tripterygium wilfordii]|uniref:Uncharacterized protein n=1 Tax=Tripterygium wilfordii TaxID=458696 RepID=A0A7J7CQ96_TRIWF|nr:hypothetical protein HS088_TW14G00398 [Tripterygium wilfordii]
MFFMHLCLSDKVKNFGEIWQVCGTFIANGVLAFKHDYFIANLAILFLIVWIFGILTTGVVRKSLLLFKSHNCERFGGGYCSKKMRYSFIHSSNREEILLSDALIF